MAYLVMYFSVVSSDFSSLARSRAGVVVKRVFVSAGRASLLANRADDLAWRASEVAKRVCRSPRSDVLAP